MIHMAETLSRTYGVWEVACRCGWTSPKKPVLTTQRDARKVGEIHLAEGNGRPVGPA